jgi:hypothetical protein
MIEHTWCNLKHIFELTEGRFYMLSEREWGSMLPDGEREEWERDLVEIDAFEAPLFAQGKLQFGEDLHEDINLPDGPFTGLPTGYTVKFITDSPEKPNNLIHPLYTKWTERIKNDPKLHVFRDPFWIE